MKLVCEDAIRNVSQRLNEKDPEGLVTIFNLKGDVITNKPIAEVSINDGRISVNNCIDGHYLFVWHLYRQTEVQIIEVAEYEDVYLDPLN